jgi:hypothetical protein
MTLASNTPHPTYAPASSIASTSLATSLPSLVAPWRTLAISGCFVGAFWSSSERVNRSFTGLLVLMARAAVITSCGYTSRFLPKAPPMWGWITLTLWAGIPSDSASQRW